MAECQPSCGNGPAARLCLQRVGNAQQPLSCVAWVQTCSKVVTGDPVMYLGHSNYSAACNQSHSFSTETKTVWKGLLWSSCANFPQGKSREGYAAAQVVRGVVI